MTDRTPTGSASGSAKGRILVIDDCTTDADLLVRAFQVEGVTNPCVIAETGQAAIAELSDCEALPALIILDVMLPEVPGMEILRALRGDPRFRDVPVVMFSGVDREEDAARARQLGANLFLCKPVDYDQLRRTVRSLKEQWLN
jgi:DNA-binding response OmpR family regulator